MTVTSSYSNNHDVTDRQHVDDELLAKDPVWRRVPVARALDGDREKIAECDRKRGHNLTLADGGLKIVCTNCPAQWKDEDF